MTCVEFKSSVTEYLEQALPAPRRADFDRHLASCANCQNYFEQMNQLIRAAPALRDSPGEISVPPHLYGILAEKSRSARPEGRNLPYRPALIALIIGVAIAAVWTYYSRYDSSSTAEVATIDLTQRSNLRGIAQPTAQPIMLRRAKLDLTIELPVAAETGKYEVGIASLASTPSLTTTGTATLVNGIANLHVQLDLTRLTPGFYRLAVRPVSWDWAFYPLKIK